MQTICPGCKKPVIIEPIGRDWTHRIEEHQMDWVRTWTRQHAENGYKSAITIEGPRCSWSHADVRIDISRMDDMVQLEE